MSTVMHVSAVVGMTSLIGVHGEAPHHHANYFALVKPEIRVVNFWAENLTAAVEKFLDDGMVQIRIWSWEEAGGEKACCIIDDPRIPKEWYCTSLCFTGFGTKPPINVAKEIYDYIGDPTNQLEMFTDPEMYYARRGGVCNNSWVSYDHSDDAPTADDLVQALLEKRSKEVKH